MPVIGATVMIWKGTVGRMRWKMMRRAMTRRSGSLVVRTCCPRGNLWLLLLLLLLTRHGPHLLHHLHLLNCGSDEFLKREAGVEK